MMKNEKLTRYSKVKFATIFVTFMRKLPLMNRLKAKPVRSLHPIQSQRDHASSLQLTSSSTDATPGLLPAEEHLRTCIEALPRHMTWLSTERGTSRSLKAAGQWFSTAVYPQRGQRDWG